MKAIRTMLRSLAASERGATVIEYGLICALIVIAIFGALQSVNGGIAGKWNGIANRVNSV